MRKLRSLWKIVFGRTTILILLMLVQFIIIFGGFAILDNKIWYINYMVGILAVIILMYLINTRQNSSFKLMWIIFILAVPVVGVSFYIYTRIQPGTSFISKRITELLEEESRFLTPKRETLEKVAQESRQELGLCQYMHQKGYYPIYDDASIKYFPLGEDKFQEMVYQLEKARDFIFMEYFIVEKGYMWDTILDILKRKVREGVEVRFMYDGTCTLSLLPKNYPQRMERWGIKCKVFSPMKPFLTTHQNNR
ncbi:MAG: PLDc N-terminal domain-containing protein, partial [Bacillota bacterium]|nr:PLDc N-terminal domain-containing protein [Bacillota bacterium]